MAKTTQEVYHCPSCGALAAVDFGDEVKICGACGFEFGHALPIAPRTAGSQTASQTGFVQRNVGSKRRGVEKLAAVSPLDVGPLAKGEEKGFDSHGVERAKEEVISDDGNKKVVRRRKKRRRAKLGPLLFLAGWAVAVMLVVIVVRRVRGDDAPVVVDPIKLEDEKLELRKQKMGEFLAKEFPECHRTLEDFLLADSTDARTQFVRNSELLAHTMRLHYLSNLAWKLPEDGRLVVKDTNLFMHKDRTTIEVIYGVQIVAKGNEEDGDGETGEKAAASVPEVIEPEPDHEVAFVSQGGRWVLDWEALVRHSSAPWQLFRDEIGVSEGVFRVYMRVGKPTFMKGEPVFMVQFFPPREAPELWKLGTERLVIPLNPERGEPENGERVQWILDRAERERKLGDSMFGSDDPPGLHRVRVALYWDGPKDDRVIKVREILAANWYGSGFEEEFRQPGESEGDPDQDQDQDQDQEKKGNPKGGVARTRARDLGRS